MVITDLKMPRMGGMEILSRIKQDFPDTIVIVITGFASVSSAVEVMKKGPTITCPNRSRPMNSGRWSPRRSTITR
ncbi:MAG: response regulator [Desulfobacterales bacterium]